MLLRRKRFEPGRVADDFDPALCFCGCQKVIPQHLADANRIGAELAEDLREWQLIEANFFGIDVQVSPLDTSTEAGEAERERMMADGSGSNTLRFHLRTTLNFFQDAMHRQYTPDDRDAKDWLREGRALRRKYYADG